MGYIKAFEILPIEIIEQVQKYVDGEIIYIPRRKEQKKSWGEGTDTKKVLSIRNAGIYADYRNGMTTRQLSERYFLAEKSIQRIIRQERNKSS